MNTNHRPPSPTFRWLIFAIGAVALTALIVWLASENPSALDGEGKRANLLYYVMLLLMVGSGVLLGRRMGFRLAIKSIAAWVAIGLVLVLGYSYRFELERFKNRILGELAPTEARMEGDTIAVRVSQDGHYYMMATVNGERVRFMVDTGASDIVLSPKDAERVGINLKNLAFTKTYNTANGIVRGAPVRLDSLGVAGIRFRDVGASVNGADLEDSLLGMSFLNEFAGYEVRDGVLRLIP